MIRPIPAASEMSIFIVRLYEQARREGIDVIRIYGRLSTVCLRQK
jgi:hypothetical protein